MSEKKLTLNAFVLAYDGEDPEILSLQDAYTVVKGRQTQKSLVAKYGSNGYATWAAFTAAGGQ